MTETLQQGVLNELGDSGVQEIANQLGTDTTTARQAVDGALASIVGGMAKNTEDPQGADDLAKALGDHTQESPATDIAALSSGGMGGAILGHVLGGKMDSVSGAVSEKTGLPADQVKKVLAIVAPIVMAYLAKRFISGGGQKADAGGVAQELQNEKQGGLGGFGDLLGKVLGG
ncbi:DUF937 domain-containing protein [Actinomadura barringtoniae]|uniref:DUF937 domain-containing protein n=1 Tax=Actinomadura barringtoniae TaxID=1427535 RepID=A0A939T627_9ACTN|nr:DUF937 domain-containing protein [Actinomadura barringtoniae]MBO2451388.1 DUF937 domain-containing protein [Actinomadura barringtoniae]